MKKMSALSVKQPYAERIMRGTKRFEYRKQATRKRERVYIYASRTPGKKRDFEEMGLAPGDLPVGVLVGTVEIIGCTGRPGDYAWALANPERLAELVEPSGRPQPVWFFPFGP